MTLLWWRLRRVQSSLHFTPFVWRWPDATAVRAWQEVQAHWLYSASATLGPFKLIVWGYW